MKELRYLTKTRSPIKAFKIVWQAGLEALKEGTTLEELQKQKSELEKEQLELARLVHDYETKIHNLARETEEHRKQNREFEWAYRALRRENQWLKEEIFKLKKK